MLAAPLRDRFGVICRLEYYDEQELLHIIRRSAKIFDVPIDEGGALEISRRSRGTPRIANRLLRRLRDFAEVKGNGVITKEIADDGLNRLGIDERGLDQGRPQGDAGDAGKIRRRSGRPGYHRCDDL